MCQGKLNGGSQMLQDDCVALQKHLSKARTCFNVLMNQSQVFEQEKIGTLIISSRLSQCRIF